MQNQVLSILKMPNGNARKCESLVLLLYGEDNPSARPECTRMHFSPRGPWPERSWRRLKPSMPLSRSATGELQSSRSPGTAEAPPGVGDRSSSPSLASASAWSTARRSAARTAEWLRCSHASCNLRCFYRCLRIASNSASTIDGPSFSHRNELLSNYCTEYST